MEEEPQLSLDTFKDRRILNTNLLSRCIQKCFGTGSEGSELETCFGTDTVSFRELRTSRGICCQTERQDLIQHQSKQHHAPITLFNSFCSFLIALTLNSATRTIIINRV